MNVVVPIVVIAVAAVAIASKVVHARRRAAKLNVSGGRKSLVMNLFGRS